MHPDDRRIRDYARGALPPADLLAVDEHLAACSSCRSRAAASRPLDEALVDLQSGLLPPESHLSDEQLEHLVDGTVTARDRTAIEAHLRQCGVCAREAGELRAWAKSRREPLPLGWLAAAAAVALFVLTPAVMRWTPMAGPRPGTGVTLAGLESLPEAAQRSVRAALEAGFAEPSAALADLRPRPEVLMGEPSPGAFRLIEPLGTVVTTDRPPFRWLPMAGAQTYTVTVFDESARRLLESPPSTDTSWTPGEPLERGRVLVWQVRAQVGGRVVTAPAPPDPPARFKVLEEGEAQVLERAARDHPTSHLLLGLLYAQAGARADAERHLEMIQPGDPHFEVARRTLERLRP